MAEKRLFKELKLLIKNHPLASNTQIVALAPVDEETSIFSWLAVIAKPTKEDNPYYYNGQWKLAILADKSYPIKPPVIKFNKATPINHPNVNINTGEICLDILKSESWSPAWNLEHLVLAILMLIDNPEPDSPLNVDLANLFRFDKLAFELMVQYTMWKLNTLYEGESEISGVKTWHILAYDISSEEEDEDIDDENAIIGSIRNGSEVVDTIAEESKKAIVDQQNTEFIKAAGIDVERSPLTSNTAELDVTNELQSVDPQKELVGSQSEISSDQQTCEVKPTSSIDIIESVGEEVKRELIEKAIEVETRSPELLDTSSTLLQAAHDRVRENVSKQVEEIRHKSASNRSASNRSASNPQPPKDYSRTEIKQDVEKVEEQFLRHIDEQVSEIRKLHERQRTDN